MPMIRYFTILFLIFGFCGISEVALAGELSSPTSSPIQEGPSASGMLPYLPPDPYYQQHVEYAKYLYKEDWAHHVVEIEKKFSENMGLTQPDKIDSIVGFYNFFAFVSAADVRMS